LSLALWSVGAICLPLLANVGSAADTNSVVSPVPASTQTQTVSSTTPDVSPLSSSEVQSLRDEVRELREELKSVKGATDTNTASLKAVSEKVGNNESVQSDLEALQDIEDENILRSIGSSSSLSSYQVQGGYQHLVNLTGFGQLGYTSVLGQNSNPPGTANAGSTAESFRLALISLSLSGYLRNDPGKDGDVRYNLGVTGSPFRYNAAANSSLASANTTAAGINGSAANGAYLNASDVWLAYDVKTTKLELEPAWTLSLQLGQYLTPYGIENPSTENNRPTINQAQYISRLGFGRDIGLVATGGLEHRNDPSAVTTPLVNYTVGVFNGAGANSFDNNNGVDGLVRLQLNPFYRFADNFRNLSFGGNILEGNLGSRSPLPTKRRFGGDIQWLRKPFLLTAEYVHSEDGYGDRSTNNPVGPAPSAAFASSDSYVGTLFWTPSTLPDFQPWVRFDRFAPKAYNNLSTAQLTAANAAGTGNNARNAYSIGFNWFIWQVNPVTRRTYASMQTDRVLKFQAGYTRFDQADSGPKGSGFTGARNQIDLLITYNF